MENGKLAFYGVWYIRDNKSFGPYYADKPVMLMKEVSDIEIVRKSTSVVKISWTTPVEASHVIVKKAIKIEKPISKFEGEEINFFLEQTEEGYRRNYFIDNNAPTNIQIYYSFYCQYSKNHYQGNQTLFTSKGTIIKIYNNLLVDVTI